MAEILVACLQSVYMVYLLVGLSCFIADAEYRFLKLNWFTNWFYVLGQGLLITVTLKVNCYFCLLRFCQFFASVLGMELVHESLPIGREDLLKLAGKFMTYLLNIPVEFVMSFLLP